MALYLMLNGLERFFIEKIRVNTRLDIFGFQPTQAEVISTLLFLTGLILWLWLNTEGLILTFFEGYNFKIFFCQTLARTAFPRVV